MQIHVNPYTRVGSHTYIYTYIYHSVYICTNTCLHICLFAFFQVLLIYVSSCLSVHSLLGSRFLYTL